MGKFEKQSRLGSCDCERCRDLKRLWTLWTAVGGAQEGQLSQARQGSRCAGWNGRKAGGDYRVGLRDRLCAESFKVGRGLESERPVQKMRFCEGGSEIWLSSTREVEWSVVR